MRGRSRRRSRSAGWRGPRRRGSGEGWGGGGGGAGGWAGRFVVWFRGERPRGEAKEWLRSLPGVGPKTAACVLMFALGRPALPVDTHVHRVAQRLGLVAAKAGAAEAHDVLEAVLEPDDVYPFHISLIKHGRRLCRAQRPLCERCPLLAGCPFGRAYVGGG